MFMTANFSIFLVKTNSIHGCQINSSRLLEKSVLVVLRAAAAQKKKEKQLRLVVQMQSRRIC